MKSRPIKNDECKVEEKKPQLENYLLGLDIIINNKQEIQVLEMQSIYGCNLRRITEFMGPDYDVIKGLKDQLQVKVDDACLIVAEGDIRGIELAQAQKASVAGDESSSIPNRGILPMLSHKWLFYRFCSRDSRLKTFIPETYVTILRSLSSISTVFPCSNLMGSAKYLFKPGSLSGGRGIYEMPAVPVGTKVYPSSYVSNLHDKFRETLSKVNMGWDYQQWLPYLPIVIQRYVHDETEQMKAKPVIRIYAMVSADVSGPKTKISLAIDLTAAYQHIRIKQDPNDFTLDNNTHELCEINKQIRLQIRQFLAAFFFTMLDGKKYITYKEWENLANEYIQHHLEWDNVHRLDILAQFAIALNEEQMSTANKLTHTQCLLLEKFLQCYQNRDAKMSLESGICGMMTSAFMTVASSNLFKYKTHRFYKLHEVVRLYHQILTKLLKPELGQEFLNIVSKYLYQEPATKLSAASDAFFNLFSRDDLRNIAQVSNAQLNDVIPYLKANSR